MRLAVCRLTSEVTVIGSRASVRLGAGAEVDLDQVVGETAGASLTLAEALGPSLLEAFEVVAAPTPKPAGRGTRPPAADTE